METGGANSPHHKDRARLRPPHETEYVQVHGLDDMQGQAEWGPGQPDLVLHLVVGNPACGWKVGT